MKARILLTASLAANVGLFGWLGFQLDHRSNPQPNAGATAIDRTVSPDRSEPSLPPASAPPRPAEFRWSQIESEDYPTYIANLRAVGAPEKTIRDIVLADVERLYQSRLEAAAPTNSEPFWRTVEQREKARQEPKRRERELNREKRALIKTLLGLDYDQSALEAWWEEKEFAGVLGFLSGSRPVEVIAAVNQFGEEDNEIDERSGGILTPEDVASKKRLFDHLLAELGRQLTPAQLEEAELRFLAAMSFAFDGGELSHLKLTGIELRELIRLKWQWDSPLNEEFEWPGQAFEEKQRRGQAEFAVRVRKLLGEDRFAEFLRETDSDFEPVHELAKRQTLSNSTALQAHEIMKATTEEITRVRRDRALRAGQRRAQMQEIRHSAAQALRQVLGERALADYLEQDAARWVIAPVKR